MNGLDYFALLLLTIAFQVPLAAVLAPRGFRRKVAPDCFLLILFTHPAAVILAMQTWLGNSPAFYLLEILVILVHARRFHHGTGLTSSQALRVSFVSNLVAPLIAVPVGLLLAKALR